MKASYLLRRHYSEARTTGADIDLQLKHCLSRYRTAGGLSLLLLSLLLAGVGQELSAEQTMQSSGAPVVQSEGGVTVAAGELDRQIDSVLQRREFVWRFPREDTADVEAELGWLTSFFDRLERMQEKFERWLEQLFNEDEKTKKTSEPFDWDNFASLGSVLSYVLIGVFVLVVLYFAVRAIRMYQPLDDVEGALDAGANAVPDLNADDVTADMLPRNEWVELAQQLIAKGEFRLALRAYFLAQLSAFAMEGLVVIRKAKSNREYARELSTRAHGRENLLQLYRSEMRLFESIWYGGRPSGPDEVQQMEAYLTAQGVLS